MKTDAVNTDQKPGCIPLQMERVHGCMEWLDDELQPTGEVQSIDALIGRMDVLCAALPFINGQMATAKQIFRLRKVEAYKEMVAQFGKQPYFSPSLAKDYVDAVLSKEAYDYDLTERCSRTIVHLIDATRTAISALKTERQVSQYAGV